jgi:hypothetical protein
MRLSWLVLAFALSVSHLYLMGSRLETERRKLEAQEDLLRLRKVTLRVFGGGRKPTAEVFWRTVERTEPLKDPWGSPYLLDSSFEDILEWRSAGPDRRFHTADDILSRIPFLEGMELIPPERPDAHIPPSRDAR